MNITSIVVDAEPGKAGAVDRALRGIAGVAVHAISPSGRLVVTVERANDSDSHQALDAIARLDGVLSAAIVYHHDESLDEATNP